MSSCWYLAYLPQNFIHSTSENLVCSVPFHPNLAIPLGNLSNFLAFQFLDLTSDDLLFHHAISALSQGHTLGFVTTQNSLPLEIINSYILNSHRIFHSSEFLIFISVL